MSKASRSNAMVVRFGQEGNFLYQSLFSGKSMDLILRPKMFYQVSGQRLVLFSQQGSRYKFGGLLLP
jgi:thymidine kinase